jgi:purine-nucleoside phosphorylase
VIDVVVLTGIELEARGLAREMELRRLSGFGFPAYGRERDRIRLRVAPVGLGAALLPGRWDLLVSGFVSPLVISAGSCGALAPGLEAGELVIPEGVIDPGGRRLNVTPGAHAAAVRLANAECGMRNAEWSGRAKALTGLLLTSREVVATPEAKASLREESGALAVDMESALIVVWASSHGCPSLVIRAVSDTAGQEIPASLIGLVTREGRLRSGRAIVRALSRPRAIPSAFALRRGTAIGLKRIARLVTALTSSLG